MSTTAEKIAIMQAYLDGKQIEYRLIGNPTWKRVAPERVLRGLAEPFWDWKFNEYRIAKEKVKGWIAIHKKSVPSAITPGHLNPTSNFYPGVTKEDMIKLSYNEDNFNLVEIEIEI